MATAPIRTATIDRHHIGGTQRHEFQLCYRDRILRWQEGGHRVLAVVVDDSTDAPIDTLKARAKAFGYTHVKYEGDWDRRTKPKNCKL